MSILYDKIPYGFSLLFSNQHFVEVIIVRTSYDNDEKKNYYNFKIK